MSLFYSILKKYVFVSSVSQNTQGVGSPKKKKKEGIQDILYLFKII